MADVATPSAIDMSLGTTNSDNIEKTHKSRPEKPDEEKYKAELAKAEKEHAAAQEKLVCLLLSFMLHSGHVRTYCYLRGTKHDVSAH